MWTSLKWNLLIQVLFLGQKFNEFFFIDFLSQRETKLVSSSSSENDAEIIESQIPNDEVVDLR